MWLLLRHHVAELLWQHLSRPPKGNLFHIGRELTSFFAGETPDTFFRLPFTLAKQTCDAKPQEANKLAIKNMGLFGDEVVGNPEGIR